MTVQSTTNRNDYVGNDSTAVYSYSYRITVDDDVRVTVRETATGTETTLAKTTDYTVSGVGDNGGGNVTLVDAGQAWISASSNLDTGYTLTLRRVVALKQTTDIRNQGDFFPEAHEDEFDKSRFIDQQQQDELDRAAKLPESVDPSTFDASLPVPVADQFLKVNSSNTGFTLESSSVSDIDDSQIAADADITRTKLAPGNPDYVLINDGSGEFSEEQFLAKSRGGTGADNSSVTFPSTGTIITEDSTSTVTNKTLTTPNINGGDIDGGTASNTNRVTLPKNTTSNLTGLTRKEGTVFYDTTVQSFFGDDGTNIIPLGGGAGGGLDVFYSEDFESTVDSSDFTSGNNATFDNGGSLAGSLADETTDNISSDTSLSYTQASGSLNDWVKSPLVPVDVKQQGNVCGASIYYTYDGDDDDIKFVVYDDTGSEIVSLSTDTFKETSGATRFDVSFICPSTSSNLAWGFQVLTENIGSELIVDDVQFKVNPFVSGNVNELTEWEAYTPVISGFGGSLTGVSFFYRRVGDSIEIYGRWVPNAPAGTEAQIGLPSGLTLDSTKLPDTFIVGDIAYNGATTGSYPALATGGDAFFNAGKMSGGAASGVSPVNGNALGSTVTHSIHAKAPIEGWAATSEFVVTPARSNLSEWENYSPALVGFGTPTNTDFKWRQVGDTVEIQGKFTSGTSTGVEAQIPLPNGYTVSTVKVPVVKLVGTGALDINLDSQRTVLATGGDTFLNLGEQTATNNGLAPDNGSGLLASGQGMSFYAAVPVQELDAGTHYLAANPMRNLLPLEITQIETSNTDAGGLTASTWTDRRFNTAQMNTDFLVSGPTSFAFELKPGNYFLECEVPCWNGNENLLRLRNDTDGTTIFEGEGYYARQASNVMGTTHMSGYFTIGAGKSLKVQHNVTTSQSGNGQGRAHNLGSQEKYGSCRIWKIS